MKLYDRVRIKSSGLTGEIIDEGRSNNKDYFILELDDQSQPDPLPTCSPDDLELIGVDAVSSQNGAETVDNSL